MSDFNSTLKIIRSFFESGSTLSYEFRKKQLLLFRNAIIKYDDEINTALYADLKKSKEETWATETGLLMGEIKNANKNLHKWMKPKKYQQAWLLSLRLLKYTGILWALF